MVLFTARHTTTSKHIYEGSIISLRLDELQTDTGDKAIREVIEHNGGVVILCQPESDQIVLVKQYRYPLDRDLLELPAGRIERDEPPLLAAQRELVEETGYQASEWVSRGIMYSAPGFCNEVLHFFQATEVTQVGKRLDEDEETDVLIISIKQAWQLVSDGEICDAKTIAGLGIISNLPKI